METEDWERQLDRIRFPQVVVFLVVVGYVFQDGFREDVNTVLRSLVDNGIELLPVLVRAEHPIVIVLFLGVVLALLFVAYTAIRYALYE